MTLDRQRHVRLRPAKTGGVPKGTKMYQHVSEAFVAIERAPFVAEKVSTQIRDFCRSIIAEGSDRLLNFGDGCAIIRPAGDGLVLRVSARDLVTFYGIRTLIESSLWKFAANSTRSIEWLPAQDTPFHAINERLTHGRGRMKSP